MTTATGPYLPLFLLVCLASAPALAQERPTEDALFGAPPYEPSAADATTTPASSSAPDADTRVQQPVSSARKPGEGAAAPLEAPDKPLQVGGMIYVRSNLAAREGASPNHYTLNGPTLIDGYLDARPSDRLRGFVLGRLLFDPTQGSRAENAVGGITLPAATTTSNPQVLLDQYWLQFDLDRVAFVTVGRQHDKWGVGHFWNPTDYLHPVQLNPLALFDERTGTLMARVAVPWEELGWNFSAMAVFQPLTQSTGSGTANLLGAGEVNRVGAAARAELVLGGFELGLDGVVQPGIRPRFGIDLSGGIWELDVHGGLGLRTGSDVPLYQGPSPFSAAATTYQPPGIRPMAVIGAEWTRKYSDDGTLTLGLEYFYDSNGNADATLYPLLLYKNALTPFYLGRHYGGAYLLLPGPGSWKHHTFVLSAVANLSDRTEIVRLDWSYALRTQLTLEAYVQGHLGQDGGEFRLSLDVPPDTVPGYPSALRVGAPTVDVGVALRLKI